MKRFVMTAAAVIAAAAITLCGCGNNNRNNNPDSSGSLVVFTDAPAKVTTSAATAAVTTEPAAVTDYDRNNDDYFRDDDADYVQQDTTTVTKKSKKNNNTKKNSAKTTQPVTEAPAETQPWTDYSDGDYVEYHFRNKKYLEQHFSKHGGEFRDDFGYENSAEYEKGASDVINNKDALFKTESEDGDGVYYIEATNEFVVLSTDGYIRTYFRPNDGINYFNRQ